MSEKPRRPGLKLIQGGLPSDEVTEEAAAVRRLIKPESVDWFEDSEIPDHLKLRILLSEIEDSGFATDKDVFRMLQGMLFLEGVPAALRKGPSDYVRTMLEKVDEKHNEHGSDTMTRKDFAIIIDDSLDDMMSIYDYIGLEPFTRSRKEKLIPYISHSQPGGTAPFWEDERLKKKLINALNLSYELTEFSTAELGQSPQDIIEALRREVLLQGVGIDLYSAKTEEELAEKIDSLAQIRLDVWADFRRRTSRSA